MGTERRFPLREATDSHYFPKYHPVAQRLTGVFNAVTGEHKEPYVLAGGTYGIYAPKLSADGTETAVTSRKALDKSCTLTPKLFFQAAAQLGAMNADPIGFIYIASIHPFAADDL